MLVSALKESSPGRISVFFEDGSEIKSTLGVITDLRLYSGRNLDERAIEELKIQSHKYLSLEKASGMLSLRMMSGSELIDKLKHKGVDEEIALFCAEKLTDIGLINDDSYSKAIVRHYSSKGYGSGRIKAELKRRGINREYWDDALDEAPEPDEKIKKYLKSHLFDPDDKKQVQKVAAALFRRGYSYEEIKRCLHDYGTENEDY